MFEDKKVKQLRDIKTSQLVAIENNPCDYAVGFYNGLEIAVATLEGREPEFLAITKEAEVKEKEKEKVRRTLGGGKIRKE